MGGWGSAYDAQLKETLSAQLQSRGLSVATYAALLSSGDGVPSHKDASIDRRQNATDMLVEVLAQTRQEGTQESQHPKSDSRVTAH
eukprot:3746486-Amphidinium_carterae.2